jgi:Cft2 family RNA processing exonuclease
MDAEADKVKHLVFKFNPVHALFPLCIKYTAFQKYNKQSKMSILYKPSERCHLIHGLTGYSAHADQQTLAAWVAAMPEPPGEIRLVHGEPHAQTALAKRLNT